MVLFLFALFSPNWRNWPCSYPIQRQAAFCSKTLGQVGRAAKLKLHSFRAAAFYGGTYTAIFNAFNILSPRPPIITFPSHVSKNSAAEKAVRASDTRARPILSFAMVCAGPATHKSRRRRRWAFQRVRQKCISHAASTSWSLPRREQE